MYVRKLAFRVSLLSVYFVEDMNSSPAAKRKAKTDSTSINSLIHSLIISNNTAFITVIKSNSCIIVIFSSTSDNISKPAQPEVPIEASQSVRVTWDDPMDRYVLYIYLIFVQNHNNYKS